MIKEYEIIFVPNKGRAIKSNKTNRIYYSEFQIIEEKGKEIERLNNIINGMEEFFKYEFEEEVRPLNSFKVSVLTICLDKLQELKGSDK